MVERLESKVSVEDWQEAWAIHGILVGISKATRNITVEEQAGVDIENPDIPIICNSTYELSNDFTDQDLDYMPSLLGLKVVVVFKDGKVIDVYDARLSGAKL